MPLTSDELISEREQALKDLPLTYCISIEEIKEKYQNVYGYREALHTAFIFHENVIAYLVEHPSVILDEEAYNLAMIAQDTLFDLYQRIGMLESYIAGEWENE